MNTIKKIGVVSPANSFLKLYPNRVSNGINYLKTLGIETVFSPHAYDNSGYTSSSVANRVDDINRFINDESIDLILASIGGHNSNNLVEHIDYKGIIKNKTKICGYSDITCILLSVHSQTGNIVYHGPTFLPEICEYPQPYDYTIKYFNNVISNNVVDFVDPGYQIKEFVDWKEQEKRMCARQCEQNTPWKVIRKGYAKSKIVGGNLPTILNLIGTKWLPENLFKDKILFIEHVNYSFGEFAAMLQSLYLRGIFDKIKGLIIGRIANVNFSSISIANIINSLVKKDIPIIQDVDLGHTDPMITIPIGATAELNCMNDIVFRIVSYQ